MVDDMKCPWCHAELEPADERKCVCSKCNKAFVVAGSWRIKMLLAGIAFAGLTVYSFMTRKEGSFLGVVLFGLIAVLLLLRSRR